MTSVSPIPPGFHSVTAHMIIKNAAEAMDFYAKAFGAVEISRFEMPGMGLLAHGLLKMGDSFIMVADEFPPDFGCPDALSPATAKGTTVSLHIYTDDVDGMYQRALEGRLRDRFRAHGRLLGRPVRPGAGPLRPPLGPGHPHQGHEPGRNSRSRRCGVFQYAGRLKPSEHKTRGQAA